MRNIASPKHRYRIAPHVHACRAGRHIVLLDLRRDRYVGFSGTDATAFEQWIEGLPPSTEAADHESPAADRRQIFEVIQQMLNDGVLIQEDMLQPLAPRPPSVDPPHASLIEGYVKVHCSIGWRDILRFFSATLVTNLLLSAIPLERISARVHRRRLRHLARSVSLSTAETERMRTQVATFLRLRPLLFTANNKCLFNSLALSEFLARSGFFPTWVFGVRTEPFRAHCWLQQDGTVIGDTPANVGGYTPIMVI